MVGIASWDSLRSSLGIGDYLRVAFLGGLVTVMAWIADSIGIIAQYGWGAVVFLGLGFFCVLSLAVTGSLALWRYYHPLLSPINKEETLTIAAQPLAAVDDNNNLPDRIAAIERELQRFENEVIAKIERIEARAESDRRQTSEYYRIVSTAIRARYAEAMIDEASDTVIPVGKKLLEGSYLDESAWARDYARWEAALKVIDGIMVLWIEHHIPFLDIRSRDMEQGTPKPSPQSKIESDINMIRYKKVWLAQTSYANRRDNIRIWFQSKGQLP